MPHSTTEPEQSDDPNGLPAQQVSSREQVELETIVDVADTIIGRFFEAEKQKREREIAFNEKILNAETDTVRRVTRGVIAIVFAVLLLAAILVFRDAVDPAINLVVWMLSVVVAALSGYGYGFTRGKTQAERRGEANPPF